jgi:predicted GIY-YIG superfamily endonuclease
MKPFFLYMLRCRDGSYYVGHTDDLERRVTEHQQGAIRGYTSERRPVVLAWSEEVPTREEALERELQLKGWSRAKKEALIRGDWADVKRLSRGPDRIRPSTPGALRAPSAQDERDGTAPSAQDERMRSDASSRGRSDA